MDDVTGETEGTEQRVVFDHPMTLALHGASLTSDAGRLVGYEDVSA